MSDYAEDYEPDYEPPYVPVTCLQCGAVEDLGDLWFHWVETHTDLAVAE